MNNAKNKVREYDFFLLYQKFQKAGGRGRRLQRNGKRIRKDSLENYENLRRLLSEFCSKKGFNLRIKLMKGYNKRDHEVERQYWKKFHLRFSGFLYDEMGHYDNYVGTLMKLLRSFFNYLKDDAGLPVGSFHKQFHVIREEVQIVALTPERLNFLIYDRGFEKCLPERLVRIKDIFVFGCTVALRISDLMNLTTMNIERINNRIYLRTLSGKTNIFSRVKLPDYCVAVIDKYADISKKLLPYYHNVYMNRYVKELCERAGWTEQFPKIRQRRGLPEVIYKNPAAKMHYRFCDMVSSHTMRRTAITTLLSLGMREDMVRNISGHSPGSREFWRYVHYAQSFQDSEVDKVYRKLKNRSLSGYDIVENGAK